jgi:hypothetical protein
MKPTNKLLLKYFPTLWLLSAGAMFIGCSKNFVQVFETQSKHCTVIEDQFIYENDTLQITYNFWSDKGLMEFTILNKLNVPIYIDLKKSSFIDDKVKLNYWSDMESTAFVQYFRAVSYPNQTLSKDRNVTRGAQAGVSITTREERITFIPPSSTTTIAKYHILPVEAFRLSKKTKSEVLSRSDNPRRGTVVFYEEFNPTNSPVIFRNFLTLSTSENFLSEFYVDNEFRLTKVYEMDKRHFQYTKLDENVKSGRFFLRDEYGNILTFSDYYMPSNFYLNIPTSEKYSPSR